MIIYFFTTSTSYYNKTSVLLFYRPTQVHRFIIRGTIEEKMYRMLKSAEASTSSHDTEENCLTVGDLTSLLKEERLEEQGENSQVS